MISRDTLSVLAAILLVGTGCLAGPGAKEPAPRVQIALLLDTSNSMDGLIDQAKATLWDVVNEFSYVRCHRQQVPELEIALYEYGNNRLSSREGFIRQVLPFSRDLDEISAKLFSLRTDGGEEFCGQVIQAASRQLDWSRSPGDLKFIFIAGNEPFDQGRVPYAAVLSDTGEKDVVVNTIFCGNYQLGERTLWADGARRGGGQYTAIDHNRAIVHVSTPYDEVIIRLNRKLNETYIGYGARGATKKRMQAHQDQNAAEMEEAVLVERAVSKSSAFYNNAEWDLVDAYSNRKMDLREIPAENLPEQLRDMDSDQLRQFLDKQKAERAAIQEEIRQTNISREAYLAEQNTGTGSDLGSALLRAVRKQAEARKYTWAEK